MENLLKILLIEDSDTDATLLVRYLKRENVNFIHTRVWLKDDFIAALIDFKPDLIIADHTLPQFSGLEAFKFMKSENKNIPFILVTGTVSEKQISQYMKEGIDDYILKENLLRLPSCIGNVVNKKKIERLHYKLSSANLALSKAYSDIESKNRSITDSINYSKRIQDASLSPWELKYKLFQQAFVLFKQKDIVSGDFYWFAEKDGKKLIAACDCTGHGVPGALMSMLGNNILNQIVNEKGITAPDKILNQLNLRIRKALKQDENNETRDGMDIALIAFTSENEIEYAGAKRPLWIIRKGVLEEIKADKFSIGGQQIEGEQLFLNNKVTLSKGDCMYIFSDGYVDQFGGPHEKKFMTKNFKNLLLSIYMEPMDKQEFIINDAIEKWKMNYEQVDDILVIGIKV
jgi:serine phosphatase RsbU (regulator of sigma subunit)